MLRKIWVLVAMVMDLVAIETQNVHTNLN